MELEDIELELETLIRVLSRSNLENPGVINSHLTDQLIVQKLHIASALYATTQGQVRILTR